MEYYSFMFLVVQRALYSYAGVSRKDITDVQRGKYEDLEKKLKVEDWAVFIVKMLNKHLLKEDILTTDFRAARNWRMIDKAYERISDNFPRKNEDFYFALIDGIKEFHDTKVYNNKLNIKEDPRSYRPLANKKFDELTYQEFLRDACLFDAIIQEYHWMLGGIGKYNDDPYGTFKGNVDLSNAFTAYKNGAKELTLEQIKEKYQHMDRFDAEKLGVYVEARYSSEPVEKHTTSSLFCNSKSMYFPATISGKPLAILKGGAMVDGVEKVYLLGDVERIESGFLEYCDIKEVIALGKIGYINGHALNGYKSTPENGIIYIKVNGNPHYFAAIIRDESLKHIKLPSDTVEICAGFISTANIESVDLSIVKKIHNSAFASAEHLKEINLPDTLEEMGIEVFRQSGINKLTIGKNLKVITMGAFQQCDNLKEVYIPENVIKIERDAFTYSENLKVAKVHVDTKIDPMAFDETVKIERYGTSKVSKTVVQEAKPTVKGTKVEVKETKKDVVKPTVNKELKTLTLTGNVFKNQFNEESDYEAIHFIGKNILIENSFRKFKNLKKITVDGNIALIDDLLGDSQEIFNITGEFYDDSIVYYYIINDNKHYALQYESNYESIIHEDCKVVGQRSLPCNKSIDFANVEFISAEACKNNTDLTTIKMSNKVKIIDKEAFYNTGLKEVILPKTLKFIGEKAFYDCEDLKVVKVPKTCKIAKNAFPSHTNVIYY